MPDGEVVGESGERKMKSATVLKRELKRVTEWVNQQDVASFPKLTKKERTQVLTYCKQREVLATQQALLWASETEDKGMETPSRYVLGGIEWEKVVAVERKK